MVKRIDEELSHPQKILLRFFWMKAWENMKNAVRRLHPTDVAGVFPSLTREEQLEFVDILFQEQLAAPVIACLPEEMARELLTELAEDKVATMIQRVSADDAVDFLGSLPEEKTAAVLECLPQAKRWFFEKLLLYDDDSAGGIMNPDFLAIDQSISTEEALRVIRNRSKTEHYLYAYVVDEMNHLIGVLSFRHLVFSDPGVKIRDIMIPDPVRVTADTPQEEVAKLVADYDLLAVPVVDENNRLLGVVTVDDIIDVIEEEATEDIYHLANLHSEINVFTPLFKTVWLRISWAMASLLTALLAALVVGLFKDTLTHIIWLAVLIPVLGTMTGNIGTQSLTVVARALVTGELEYHQGWKVVFKELAAGFLLGIIIGTPLGLLVYFLLGQNVLLALLVGVSMIISLLLSTLFGAFIPLLLGWLGLDPVRGANLVVTTIANVVGFFVFLGLARWLLPHLTG
ncbi:MAG: magnesium transporter [Acidobacteria bacterium]|nr:magnesium transporter [Acidobacteriota bacterium]